MNIKSYLNFLQKQKQELLDLMVSGEVSEETELVERQGGFVLLHEFNAPVLKFVSSKAFQLGHLSSKSDLIFGVQAESQKMVVVVERIENE